MLIVLAVFAVVGIFLMLRLSTAGEEARTRVRQTTRVLVTSSSLAQATLDAETGQRGFLLTGDPDYLLPFYDAQTRTEEFLSILERSARASPDADRLLQLTAELRRLIDDKFAELNDTLELFQTGDQPGALGLVQSHIGNGLTRAIRTNLDELAAIEEAHLSLSFDLAEKSQRQAAYLLSATVLFGLFTFVFAAGLARRTLKAEAEAAILPVIRQERDRADLLSHELSHRVKNLFAVILSIISSTARNEPDPREVARKSRERIQALARAHALSAGLHGSQLVPFLDLLDAVARPYAPSPTAMEAEGPDVSVPALSTTPIALILNELATNATKHGAWAQPDGKVQVRWGFNEAFDGPSAKRAFTIHWDETGALQKVDRSAGFGMTMVGLSAAQIDGEASYDWAPDGLRFTLRLPDFAPGDARP